MQMSELKIGDRVRMTACYLDRLVGGIAKVVRSDIDGIHCIEFENPSRSQMEVLHEGPFNDGRETCWYLDDTESTKVELIESRKPKSLAKQAYKGNGQHSWEKVTEEGTTQRLRIPGGWIYRDSHVLAAVFIPMPEVVKHKV
jgi:hypothetical protein